MLVIKSVQIEDADENLIKTYHVDLKFKREDFKKVSTSVLGEYKKLHPGKTINLVMHTE
jgi:hypothetical protein